MKKFGKLTSTFITNGGRLVENTRHTDEMTNAQHY